MAKRECTSDVTPRRHDWSIQFDLIWLIILMYFIVYEPNVSLNKWNLHICLVHVRMRNPFFMFLSMTYTRTLPIEK